MFYLIFCMFVNVKYLILVYRIRFTLFIYYKTSTNRTSTKIVSLTHIIYYKLIYNFSLPTIVRVLTQASTTTRLHIHNYIPHSFARLSPKDLSHTSQGSIRYHYDILSISIPCALGILSLTTFFTTWILYFFNE